MLTIEQMRARLADRNLKTVADNIGVHEQTIYRIVNGTTKPSYETLAKLSDYLEATCRL